MEYIFEKVPKNYEDFASGRVLYNAQGTTSFPVRLASELFQRAKSYLKAKGAGGQYTVYDPCCGGAFLLTTLGLLHGGDLSQLVGSDIDDKVLELAAKNLFLINADGMEARIDQIHKMILEYGKDSHKQALESALLLKKQIVQRNSTLMYNYFQADATDSKHRLKPKSVDLVITDVPYGDMVQWKSEDDSDHPIEKLLEHLYEMLKPTSIICIVADKKQKISNIRYKRLDRFKVGKRQVAFLEPIIGGHMDSAKTS
ncbi:hypothetical protein [Marinicrinis lubricantis]|uniref:rRNA methyltransferase AviRa n=1 Tax=Marinicrinis lubricantis TaxID=2086470 RepID=A0ABW1IQJ3_9BACL